MNNPVTTFEEAVAKRVAEMKAEKRARSLDLVNNEKFMNTQAKLSILGEEVSKLDNIITQLNTAITPFIGRDGTKYQVRVFPISQFGIGLDKLIGIIAGSASAFTDDMAMQYEAIAGIPFIELQIANDTLGSVDYVNKDGIYVEGSRTLMREEVEDSGEGALAHLKAVKKWEDDNIEELYNMLQSIAMKMNFTEIVPSKEALKDKVAQWEMSAQRRAKKQESEIQKMEALNESSEFTISD